MEICPPNALKLMHPTFNNDELLIGPIEHVGILVTIPQQADPGVPLGSHQSCCIRVRTGLLFQQSQDLYTAVARL
jgi:hypothetical protein